ncbi:hypothetical protein TNCV_2438231 [Trichonephila clavipes]|nr:hypothetical protein TNCV_2438231 [Trichonephila clavipes]
MCRPYAAAIGKKIILDNARPHRAIVEGASGGSRFGTNGMASLRFTNLNPIEHLWDYLGREVAALNPLLRRYMS